MKIKPKKNVVKYDREKRAAYLEQRMSRGLRKYNTVSVYRSTGRGALEARERNRRCRECGKPVTPTSYWHCGAHNWLKDESADKVYTMNDTGRTNGGLDE